jgi:hypothetical protein
MQAARAGLAAILLTSSFDAGAATSYEADVRPVLERYCLNCHNENVASGSLNLAQYTSAAAAQPESAIWVKVREKISARKMPPPGLPAPAPETLATIVGWIDGLVGKEPTTIQADPGRVTARRLNRLEYNNTIRDLLKLSVRPADDFPVDNSGYGFDNIGDVLSLSPMLMEKYMAAARQLSRLAVYGEPAPPKPLTLAHYVTKRSPDMQGSASGPGVLPYSLRGALYTKHVFPWTADYEFRYRVVNFRYVIRPRGSPPLTPEESRKLFPAVEAVLTINGKRAGSTTITGSLAYEFDRGDVVTRVRVPAGEHDVRISFPHLAAIGNPRDNVNADQRRKLWIDYLDIAGPFAGADTPPESYRQLFICGHPPGQHQPGCTRRVIRDFAARAYRRPVTQAELKRLVTLADAAKGPTGGVEENVRAALQAVLVSPHFLFRIEHDEETPAAHEISEYELASRLSYFLWSSMPDEELFRLAAARQLRLPGVLQAQVRRMLADPKSSALVDGFAAQWLQLRNLDRVRPDTKIFPRVDEELLAAMRQESNLFIASIINEDRSVLDLLDGRFTWVNGPLAKHYGMEGVSGEEFQRIPVDGNQRGGLLTHASVLTVSSYPTRTSPVLRGKWVLDNLLGAPPPPPPPNIPELKEENLAASSLREQLEKHRTNPSCASCHDQMDPIGFGLETYDAVGAWRTHDGEHPIDASGRLPGGDQFNGPRELIRVLRRRPEPFLRSLTERLLTYALGRGLERYDVPAVTAIAERTADGEYRFSRLVLEIVNSSPFQQRRGTGGGDDSR